MLARIPAIALLALLSSSSTICRPCDAALKPQLDVELSDYATFDREDEEEQVTAAATASKNLRGAADVVQQRRTLSSETTNDGRNEQQQDERNAVESFFSPANNDNSNSEIIPTPRIVNGGRANTGRFPYYTSIYTDSWWGPPAHSCGGSLIAPDVVLCAAHCYDPRNPPKSVRVGAYSDNDWSNSNGGQLPFHDSKILDVIIHPRYNTNSLNYDFALFKIVPVKDRELLRSIVKVDVGGRQLESYDSLTAIGLGRIYTNGPLAEYLQEVELKYVANCNRYFRWPGTITNQSKLDCGSTRFGTSHINVHTAGNSCASYLMLVCFLSLSPSSPVFSDVRNGQRRRFVPGRQRRPALRQGRRLRRGRSGGSC